MRIDRSPFTIFRFYVRLAAGIVPFLLAGPQSNAQTNTSKVSAKASPKSTSAQPWKIVFDRNMIAPSVVLDAPTPQNIFTASTDKNSAEIELTNDNLSSRPVWSPDGKKIASVREGICGGIFVMDADGKNVRRITNDSI